MCLSIVGLATFISLTAIIYNCWKKRKYRKIYNDDNKIEY